MKINNKIAQNLSDMFKINHNVVPFNEWKIGLNIELEHGKRLSKITNVTNDDLPKTAQIVIAHLLEDPRYYYYLEIMEKQRKTELKKSKKLSIFI